MYYKLSPSDFAYIYEECKHCFYLKIKEGISRPSMPFPGVFSALNTRIQGSLVGKNLKTLSSNLPDCEVITQEGYVESVVIPGTSCYIKGKYDLLCKNPDGNYTLVDLKISQPDEEKIEKYKTQLTAYKFSMENPAREKPIKITRMGLLIFYPNTLSFENNTVDINFPPKWMEIPADDNRFITFIKEMDTLLNGPIPEASPGCGFCKYVKTINTYEY